MIKFLLLLPARPLLAVALIAGALWLFVALGSLMLWIVSALVRL